MLLDLRSLYEEAGEITGTITATFGVTATSSTGTVDQNGATYGVTQCQGVGTVVNPAVPVTGGGSGGLGTYRLPMPEAPRQQITGTMRVTMPVTEAKAQGDATLYITGDVLARFETTASHAQGRAYRKVIGGTCSATFKTISIAEGVYDRTLWDRIEDEEKLLEEILIQFVARAA